MYRLCGLALVCILSIVGCKAKELKETASNVSEKPTDTNSVLVAGRLERGTIADARVSLLPMAGGRPAWDETLGSGFTDSNGRFSIAIESRYLGMPVVLRAEILSGRSLIKCDLTDTCGEGAAFGDRFTASRDSELVLAVPALLKSRQHNITVFSHVAYRLVESQLTEPPPNGNALADIQLQHNIARANSQIASRFGIIGDLVSVELIDVTRRAEVESASVNSLGHSLLGSSIIKATMNANPASSFGDLVDDFSAQYISAGVPGNSEMASVVSYADILDVAIAAVSSLQSVYPKDMSGLVSEFSVAKGLAATEEADQFSAGVASQTSGLTSIEKGKSFVDDIRRVALSIDLKKIVMLSKLSELVDGNAADALMQFGLQLDAAEILQGKQADRIYAAFGKVIAAVLNALVEFYGGSAVSPSYEGLSFTHSATGDLHTFLFQTSHDFCSSEPDSCPTALSLIVKLKIVDFGGNVGSQLIAASYMDIQFIGAVSYEDLTMRFPANSSPVKIEKPMFRLQETTEGDFDISNYLLRGENIEGSVPILLEKSDGSGLTLNGLIAFVSEKLWAIGKNSESVAEESDGSLTVIRERSVSVRELQGFKMDVAASIRNHSNETFLGAVNVMQGGKALSEIVSWKNNQIEHCAADGSAGDCEEVGSETVIEGETAENFLALNASVGFKANLKGISTPVIIEMSGSRDSPTTNTINSMKVSYPGHAVSLNGRFNNKGGIVALDATNLDGMHLFMDTVNGKRTGAVETPTREKVADVIDMGQWVKIRYTDGYFESL